MVYYCQLEVLWETLGLTRYHPSRSSATAEAFEDGVQYQSRLSHLLIKQDVSYRVTLPFCNVVEVHPSRAWLQRRGRTKDSQQCQSTQVIMWQRPLSSSNNCQVIKSVYLPVNFSHTERLLSCWLKPGSLVRADPNSWKMSFGEATQNRLALKIKPPHLGYASWSIVRSLPDTCDRVVGIVVVRQKVSILFYNPLKDKHHHENDSLWSRYQWHSLST